MTDHSNPDRLQSPEQIDREAQAQREKRDSVIRDVNNPEHYKLSAEARAHGTHGRGGEQERLVDEQATDTGDDPQLRRAGGGGDQPPEPNAFRENSSGRMGGAGWGSEQAGGSTVDRRPNDSNA